MLMSKNINNDVSKDKTMTSAKIRLIVYGLLDPLFSLFYVISRV